MSLVKSKQRVADHGEVFTPEWMVEAMLDLVKGETERIDSRFLESACEDGNFLVKVLQRKLAAVELKYGKSDFERRHFALLALMCIYGIELLPDNIAECRANLLEIFAGYLDLQETDDLYLAGFQVLSLNLVHGDAMKMLNDNRLRSIDDYLSASDVFPGVGLKGGVCFFLWDKDHAGQCRVATHFKDWPESMATRQLLEKGADVFIRFNEGLSILKKVVTVEKGETDSLALPENKRFDKMVSSRKPFGLETTFKGKATKRPGDVMIYQNGGTGYVARDSIRAGTQFIDKWKVFMGYAAPGTGNKDTYPHRIISTPFIGEPESISSETYLCIGPLDSKKQAESVLSYLTCRLTRLLILLYKPSQHVTRKVYTFVPTQKWTKRWTTRISTSSMASPRRRLPSSRQLSTR